MVNKVIKVFLADDHPVLRFGLQSLIEKADDLALEIVGQASDGREALVSCGKLRPDLVITDISMPNMDGIKFIRELRKYNEQIKIIILTQHENVLLVKESLDLKVNGYLLKNDLQEDLIKAIKMVLNDKQFIAKRLLTEVSNYQQQKNRMHVVEEYDSTSFKLLSPRESEITKLLAEGKSSEEICELLDISNGTFKTHRKNIYRKIGVNSQIGLVRYAFKSGLVE